MLLWFVAASSMGAVARFSVERLSVRHLGERQPWGTLFANLAGSLLLGLVVGTDRPELTVLIGSAFCGAFTTFGGFIGQTHSRVRHQATRLAGVTYFVVTVTGSLAAAWLGIIIVAQ